MSPESARARRLRSHEAVLALLLVAELAIFAVLGTNLAKTILERLSDVQFRRWMKGLMIAIGLFYLAQGVYLYATQ